METNTVTSLEAAEAQFSKNFLELASAAHQITLDTTYDTESGRSEIEMRVKNVPWDKFITTTTVLEENLAEVTKARKLGPELKVGAVDYEGKWGTVLFTGTVALSELLGPVMRDGRTVAEIPKQLEEAIDALAGPDTTLHLLERATAKEAKTPKNTVGRSLTRR